MRAHCVTMDRYTTFRDFYPFYLSQHQDRTCRRLHVVGSLLVLTVLAYALGTGRWLALWALPVVGYGFAWVGHFFFEKNRPATFRYPLYSFIGDWAMYRDIWLGRIKL